MSSKTRTTFSTISPFHLSAAAISARWRRAAIALGRRPQTVSSICDGGGVTIDKSPSDGLSISLHNGGIAFGGDCDTTTGTWVRPGADDKIFHLDPAPEEACKTLEKKQLGGWDDELGR
jgi:hypothetical protein